MTVLIKPLVLPTDEFPQLPLDPGFAKLAQDELGNVVTPTDGSADIVAEAIAIVDGVDSALDVLGGGLLDAFAEADLIDAKPVSDTVAGFTASLVPTSSAVDALGTLLGSAAAPTPGGGGGGTGTGTPFRTQVVVRFSGQGAVSPLRLCLEVFVQ